jgi:hypothetical protein
LWFLSGGIRSDLLGVAECSSGVHGRPARSCISTISHVRAIEQAINMRVIAVDMVRIADVYIPIGDGFQHVLSLEDVSHLRASATASQPIPRPTYQDVVN